MAEYQHTHSGTTVLRRADTASVPVVPSGTTIAAADPYGHDGRTLQDWLDGGGVPDPADPLPIEYARTTPVDAKVVTTTATVLEVFRFPCGLNSLYEASLKISGIDRADFTSLVQEGRFVWKRVTAGALPPGITVVSQIPSTIPTGWATNCFANGTDIVFTVKGPSGRTLDWLLVGSVAVFAPGGL